MLSLSKAMWHCLYTEQGENRVRIQLRVRAYAESSYLLHNHVRRVYQGEINEARWFSRIAHASRTA